MEELRDFYRSALAGRIRALETAAAAGLDEEARATVRRIAHALRGSGTTYGFPVVTAAATRAEEAADERLPAELSALLAVLREVAAGLEGH